MATTANKNCKQFTGVVLEEITAREGDVPGKGKVALKTVLYNEDEDENRIEESGSTEIEVFNRSTSTFAENEEVDIWQDGYGVFWVTPINSIDKKFIGLCESSSYELKFTKCGLNGDRLTYDTDEQVTASVPPYIDAVEQGGHYLIDWFSEYNCWVVVAGTCAEDNREYQPYTTVSLTQHVKDGTSSGSTPLSGTAASIGEHDEYATLETNLIWTQDIIGYPGRSSNMFFQTPTFALNSNRDEITFSGLKLNPGAVGIVVYQFVVTNCNGSCRDVYTVAFKLVEENAAPEVAMTQTSFTLQPDGTFDGDIGTVTQTGQDANDTLVIYDKQITGDSNILATNTLTVNQSTKKIHLYLKARDTKTGTCQITFYVDDSHNLTATTGEYEQVALNITVEQTAPTTAS